MTLLIYPVVVGQGTRLFPDTDPGQALGNPGGLFLAFQLLLSVAGVSARRRR
jgi:hypothetical protein